MRLTKKDGEVLLGAIRAELDSQQWAEIGRGKYRGGEGLPFDTEQHIREQAHLRAEELRRVRDKIKSQLVRRK